MSDSGLSGPPAEPAEASEASEAPGSVAFDVRARALGVRDRLYGAVTNVNALVVLWGAVALWTIVVGRLVVRRHNNFGTFDYDLGIHDQAIWLLSRGMSFNTVRGMASLGHHATFNYFFLSPLSWLGAGPNTWNVLQCLAIASGAVPLYVIARRRFGQPLLGLAVGLAWLLQPWLSWFAQETFHPEVMAMPFLLWAYALLDPVRFSDQESGFSRRDVWGLVVIVVALAWKEDVALAVLMLGFAISRLGRKRIGRRLMAMGLAWWVVFGVWLVPAWAGGKATYGGIYGRLGESSVEVALTSIFEPNLAWEQFTANHGWLYIARLFLPFAFLALASPWLVLVMVPQFFANILTTVDFTSSPKFHYQAIPMVALALATVEGIHRLSRNRFTGRLGAAPFVALFLVVSFVGARGWGILPFGEEYRKGAWPLVPADNSGWEAALKRVGPDDGVAAHYLMVPHLSQREQVYTFPNPWTNSYYGISPDDLGDPTKVDWIVVWKGALNEAAQKTLDDLLASGEFGDPEEVNNIVSYRRLKPAGG